MGDERVVALGLGKIGDTLDQATSLAGWQLVDVSLLGSIQLLCCTQTPARSTLELIGLRCVGGSEEPKIVGSKVSKGSVVTEAMNTLPKTRDIVRLHDWEPSYPGLSALRGEIDHLLDGLYRVVGGWRDRTSLELSNSVTKKNLNRLLQLYLAHGMSRHKSVDNISVGKPSFEQRAERCVDLSVDHAY
jgi:hypothetical protein